MTIRWFASELLKLAGITALVVLMARVLNFWS